MRKAIFIAAMTAVTAISAIPAAAQYYYRRATAARRRAAGSVLVSILLSARQARSRGLYYRATGQPDPYLSGTRGRMNQGASPVYPEGRGTRARAETL